MSTIVLQDSLLQTSLAQERHRWKKEEESVRTKAIEAAVAIAEVKWLEDEQKKISEAVEQAVKMARETWQEEKKRDIGINMYGKMIVHTQGKKIDRMTTIRLLNLLLHVSHTT